MRTTVSWKDGGALLPQAFVMMLIATATLVSAEYPPLRASLCNKCDVLEDNYRGPTWAYPCMRGYQGPKKADLQCKEEHLADGCFRRLTTLGGKKVMGGGGCFANKNRACIEEVTKVKFDPKTNCIPETVIDPAMNKQLFTKCELGEIGDEVEKFYSGAAAGGGGDTSSAAPSTRRRKREAADEFKGYICVCFGDDCNNQGGALGPRSGNGTSAVSAIKPMSAAWIGVASGMGLVGGFLLG